MKQLALAKEVGVSQPHLNKIIFTDKTGKRPSWRLAKKLAEATGTVPELWLEGTSEEIKAALDRLNAEASDNQKQEAGAQPQEAVGL